jgi:hypothetical protein
MARPPKYDWIKLKEDWLLSDINELSEYFANLNTPIPKHTYKTKTVGWRDEKEAFKEKLSSAKIGKALRDPDITAEKEKILKQQEIILTAKNHIVAKLAELFGGKNSVIEKFETKDAIAVVNLLKTELGETTTIGKNKIEGSGENGRIEIFRKIIEMP